MNTAQTAQTAVNTQAQTAVQSVSGVNLDEEAANLMQWQQAYQASAQALSVANTLFTTLLDSVNGTYTKDRGEPSPCVSPKVWNKPSF